MASGVKRMGEKQVAPPGHDHMSRRAFGLTLSAMALLIAGCAGDGSVDNRRSATTTATANAARSAASASKDGHRRDDRRDDARRCRSRSGRRHPTPGDYRHRPFHQRHQPAHRPQSDRRPPAGWLGARRQGRITFVGREHRAGSPSNAI